jgi:hypothetical protein
MIGSILDKYLQSQLTTSQPYTYRNGLTLLELIQELAKHLDDTNADIVTLRTAVDKAIEEISSKVDRQSGQNDEVRALALKAYEAALQAIGLEGGSCYDVAHGGMRPVEIVAGHVYDRNRVKALTAAAYDACDFTAGEFDALGYSADKYDLEALRNPEYSIKTTATKADLTLQAA